MASRNAVVRIVLALGVVAGAAYLVVAFMAGGPPEPAPGREGLLSGPKGATSIIKNFHHVESRLDKVNWELGATQAELVDDQAMLHDLTLTFYTPERDVIVVRGDSGHIDLNSRDIEVTGNVQASYNDSYRFFSQEVTWDDARKLLTAPGDVRITGPGGRITGKRLVARPNRKRFTLEGGVTVDYQPVPGARYLTGGENRS